MPEYDLDRLERLARGLAVLFYALLFLAFITAIMGSGGGGLLLLMLGAVAHVGRVGLEELVAKRRGAADGAAPEGEEQERAIGLSVRWLPREIRLPRGIHLPRELRLPRGGGGATGAGEAAGAALGQAGEAAGAALGHAGAALARGRASLGPAFAALVAEVRERPARRALAPGEEVAFEPLAAELDDREEDLDEVQISHPGGNEDFDGIVEPRLWAEFAPEPARPERARPEPAEGDSPSTAQERYEARERARRERRGAEADEPLAAAVEAAEQRAPQRVRRRHPGGRPDPLQTRRPTRSF